MKFLLVGWVPTAIVQALQLLGGRKCTHSLHCLSPLGVFWNLQLSLAEADPTAVLAPTAAAAIRKQPGTRH
jgi:hypothetical protein